jgi:transposase
MDLTDTLWDLHQPLNPAPPRRPDGRGRPWADNRQLLNGMLWVLRTGAQWEDLPRRYGTKSTCHRRFQQWVDAGVFERILAVLADDLHARGDLDLSECFVDATFASAKKGDLPSGRPAGARAARSWQWQTALVFLSPSTLQLLRQVKSPLLSRYSSAALSLLSRSG